MQGRPGLCPRPHWGRLQHSPRPPSSIKGPPSRGGGKARGGGGEGKGGEVVPPLFGESYAPESNKHTQADLLLFIYI